MAGVRYSRQKLNRILFFLQIRLIWFWHRRPLKPLSFPKGT